MGWIESVATPFCAGGCGNGAVWLAPVVPIDLGFGCFGAPLRGFGRGSALRAALAKAEIDILLEFLELFRESAGLELHLFDLPIDLPHLAFEPSDPDKETR